MNIWQHPVVRLISRHKSNNYFIMETDIYKNLLVTQPFQQIIGCHYAQFAGFT